jgi:hypothetical protein
MNPVTLYTWRFKKCDLLQRFRSWIKVTAPKTVCNLDVCVGTTEVVSLNYVDEVTTNYIVIMRLYQVLLGTP